MLLNSLITLALVGCLACGSQEQEASESTCFTELMVYDPHGYKLPFVISGVFAKGRREEGDVRQIKGTPYGFGVKGARLSYSKRAIGISTLELVLVGPRGENVRTEVNLLACRQRNSVQHGNLHDGADAAASRLSGRIAGCNMDGDWWIKATPMFADNIFARAYEGLVNSDGSFEIVANFWGGRHIIVVGKEREPIKALSMDITEGGNNFAMIDLGGLCPSQNQKK